jgi:hypothetical protein
MEINGEHGTHTGVCNDGVSDRLQGGYDASIVAKFQALQSYNVVCITYTRLVNHQSGLVIQTLNS